VGGGARNDGRKYQGQSNLWAKRKKKAKYGPPCPMKGGNKKKQRTTTRHSTSPSEEKEQKKGGGEYQKKKGAKKGRVTNRNLSSWILEKQEKETALGAGQR